MWMFFCNIGGLGSYFHDGYLSLYVSLPRIRATEIGAFNLTTSHTSPPSSPLMTIRAASSRHLPGEGPALQYFPTHSNNRITFPSSKCRKFPLVQTLLLALTSSLMRRTHYNSISFPPSLPPSSSPLATQPSSSLEPRYEARRYVRMYVPSLDERAAPLFVSTGSNHNYCCV